MRSPGVYRTVRVWSSSLTSFEAVLLCPAGGVASTGVLSEFCLTYPKSRRKSVRTRITSGLRTSGTPRAGIVKSTKTPSRQSLFH